VGRILVVQHEEHAPLGTLAGPLAEHELVTWRPDLGEPVPSLRSLDGLLPLGGTPHPDHDEHRPWLPVERDLLREALAAGTPVLGVCLGSQVLAQAAGGEAGPAERPEIGWHDVRLTAAAHCDPLLGGLPDRFWAFEWHHYRFSVPAGAQLLASTPAAGQAFRVGERAWGLQFHVEVDAPLVEQWIDLGVDELQAHGLDPDELRADTGRRAQDYARIAEHVAGRFAGIVAARARAA
jgi:GMP synthase-like glutamine amidotransferase